MKNKTAVQWLVEELTKQNMFMNLFAKEINQALAMEWEQLIEANADGQYLNSVSLTKKMCLDNAESYYNEKYGK